MQWNDDEIEELVNNYAYYAEHKEEAEKFFMRKWLVIKIKASHLGIVNFDSINTKHSKYWTDKQIKTLRENYEYYVEHKEEAEKLFNKSWYLIKLKASHIGIYKFNDINRKNSNYWTDEQINDLNEKYFYYIDHKDEAEEKFKRKWNVIKAKASHLGIFNLSGFIDERYWKYSEKEELKKNYFYYLEHKDEAEEKFKRSWNNIATKASDLKITSMRINKNCSMFLGCHVAEKVLSYVFKDVERMPNGNRGFDFICNKGYKIDVKSCCLCKNYYTFIINQNKIADYFLLIGFDNRKDLNPQHIWLIKSNEIINTRKSINRKLSDFKGISIPNNECGLFMYLKYELTDKLKETIDCCTELKSEYKPKLRIIRRKKII